MGRSRRHRCRHPPRPCRTKRGRVEDADQESPALVALPGARRHARRPAVQRNGQAAASRSEEAVHRERKRVVEGKSVSVSVDLGGRRIIKKKRKSTKTKKLRQY